MSLVLSLVAHHCDVPTRCTLSAVERNAQVAFEECILSRPSDYLLARRVFRHWLHCKRVSRIYRNSWSRRRRDPERMVFVC